MSGSVRQTLGYVSIAVVIGLALVLAMVATDRAVVRMQPNATALPAALPEPGNELFEFYIEDVRYTARGYPDRFLMHGDSLIESLIVGKAVDQLRPGTGLWDATQDEPMFIGRIVAITPPG